MGGVVSTGQDNDDLITNLLQADYIKTPMIERVFRAVDRAEYFLEEARGNAYKDLAWKSGNLHLSAPCIYSEVMEGLSLAPGLSFLNLGSGTGYLSTMVGLILGPYGINHGIEIHEDVVQYANDKLTEFKKSSTALDEYEFCPPRFIQGNCLCLNSDFPQYDRVYCGAACPENHENYMKNLIKVGGILVMPLNDKLLKITRTSETTWDETFLLAVSFASLILPSSDQDAIKPLDFEPLSLQSICRSAIRTILRRNIDIEYPDLKKSVRKPPKRPKKKRALRRLVVPIFEDSELDISDNLTDDEDRGPRDLGRVTLAPERGAPTGGRDINSILDLVFGLGHHCRNDLAESASQETESENLDAIEEEVEEPGEEEDDETGAAATSSAKREKSDSGLGEDLLPDRGHSSDSELAFGMDIDSEDSEDNSNSSCERSHKRSPLVPSLVRTGEKLKRIALSSHRLRNLVDSDSDSEVQTDEASPIQATRTLYLSPYTPLMRAKIQALPLPPMLKAYLNLYREF